METSSDAPLTLYRKSVGCARLTSRATALAIQSSCSPRRVRRYNPRRLVTDPGLRVAQGRRRGNGRVPCEREPPGVADVSPMQEALPRTCLTVAHGLTGELVPRPAFAGGW